MQKLHDIYTHNIAMFPVFYDILAKQLDVSVESLQAIEVGLCPLDKHNNWAWTFPERDAKGKVIGLSVRLLSGKKYAIDGSKRGLTYAVNYERLTQQDAREWERVSQEKPCPLCDKPDGCMYPKGEYENPNALVCVRISEGSVKPLGVGYLHILRPSQNSSYSILLPSEQPTFVVEGASDVCAAYDLGFVAVGKPSAQGGSKFLTKVLVGRKSVVFGENDAGAGKAGMESTFAQLRDVCPELVKIMPPEGVKDLRYWKGAGITQEALLDYINKAGDSVVSEDIFEDDIAYNIANTWICKKKKVDGKIVLRTFRNGFIEFDGRCYQNVSDDLIRGQVYNYLAKKSFLDATGAVKPYKPTRAKVGDILDACNSFCPIDQPCPSWLNDNSQDSTRLIVFQNGILDVNDYTKGKITLYDSTPDLFTFNVLPYDFNEDLHSKIWEDFINDIFNKDENKIALLAEWFGYNTVPDLSYEKLMLFTGRPRSGKSTVLETLQAMLGDNSCCETSFQSLAGAFGYQPLIGKLSAIIGDAKSPKSGEADSVLEKILHITGGDAVSINIKNKPALPLIRLCCRFTIAMNDLPAFTDHSRAFEYRTNILKFNNSYVGKEDRTLKARLRQEAASGKLINFALSGLTQLYAGRDFIVPDESAQVMRTFRELVSPIIEFAEKCIEHDGANGVPVDYLYVLWKWWSSREGRQPGLKSTFVRNLLSTITDGVQIREGEVDNSDRVIMGVKVTQYAEKEFLKGE